MATEENVETIRKQLQCVEFMGMVMACPILERAQTPGIGYRERGVYGGKGGGGPGDTSLSQHELEELLPYRVAHTASTVICAEVRCGKHANTSQLRGGLLVFSPLQRDVRRVLR